MTEATAFNWASYITHRLTETLDLPSTAIAVPTAAIEEALREVLHTANLSLACGEPTPVTSEEVAKLIEGHSGAVYLPALGGPITWIFSEETLRTLFSKLLRKSLGADESLAPDLLSGVQKVIAAQVFAALAREGFAPASGALIQSAAIPNESGALYPITCTFDETTLNLQLFIPYSALAKLEKKASAASPEQLHSWRLSLALEIGAVDLSLSELKGLHHGDCLLLDRCTIDPATYHGTLSFNLNGRALFRAKLKASECKLLDYPFDAIGAAAMDDMNPNEMNPNETQDESPWLESEAMPQTPQAEANAPTTVRPAATTLNPDQIPLSLKIELGHIEMSAARLSELSPGQVLDLGIRPEQGVDCTVGGKRVAKGLLVKVGEMIGVRITEIKS